MTKWLHGLNFICVTSLHLCIRHYAVYTQEWEKVGL